LMRSILVISILSFLLITLLFIKKARADKIEHFRYEACYSPVPIRAAPDPNATKTGEIPKGETIRVTKQKSYWVKVIYEDADGNFTIGWSASTAMCPVE
jgi:SH3 domain-containing protein